MALNLPSALVAALLAQQDAGSAVGVAGQSAVPGVSTAMPTADQLGSSAPSGEDQTQQPVAPPTATASDPSQLTGTIGTMLKQALASGNQNRLTQIVQNYGNLPEFIQGNYIQYLPQAMQQDIQSQVQAQQTADATKQQAAALAAQKPSFNANASIASQNGMTWTQADQDAQEAGAPVGFKTAQAQTDYTNMLKGSIAPAGVSQYIFGTLSSALKSASDKPNGTWTASIKNALRTLPTNPTPAEQATIKKTLEASAARAVQGGADPQVVANALKVGMGQALLMTSNPASILSAFSQVQMNGQQLLAGVNPQTALLRNGNGYILSPEGYKQLGQVAQQTGNEQFQTQVVGLYDSADTLYNNSSLTSGFTKAWQQNPLDLNTIRAAANPNDPNLNTGSQSTIDAIRTVGSASIANQAGNLSTSDQLSQALAVLQGGGAATSGADAGTTNVAAAAVQPQTVSTSRTTTTPQASGSTASKSDYPNLWNANGQWIGSTDTNDNPYDPVTNPYGMMSFTSADQNSPATASHGAPVAIYDPTTGTWSGDLGAVGDLPDSSITQNQQNLTTAMANAGVVQSGSLFGLTSANAAAAANANTNYNGTGSSAQAGNVTVPQAQSGLGGGPGTTYPDTANGALPAPFDIANAQTNNAAAQSLSDAYSAQMQHALNNPNQSTPLGNLTYTNTGTEANPIWTATSSNTSADQNRALAGTLAGQANVSQLYQNNLNPALATGLNASQIALANAVGTQGVTNYDVMSQGNIDQTAGRLPTAGGTYVDPTQVQGYAQQNNPTNNLSDFSGAMSQAQNAAYGNFQNLMEPGYAQEQERTRSQLLNQGLQEGSQAYQTAMDNLARQQNYARTTAANNAVLTGNQTGLAQMQQLAANQGQSFTQQANALQQALTGQLSTNNQNFTQGSTNYQNLWQALAAQGGANQANQAANQTAKSSTATAVNAGLTPLSNLATTVAGLSAPTMQNFGTGTATNVSPAQITTAMQNQSQAGLNNSNALIQAVAQQQTPAATQYNIDAAGNSWLSQPGQYGLVG